MQAVLEQTLHQCGINGKSSLKSYWNRLESESRRLNEVAKEQLGKLQEPKVESTIPKHFLVHYDYFRIEQKRRGS